MANTVTFGNGVIQIVPDANTDFDIADYLKGPIRLMGVDFGGSAVGDTLVVRDKSATGAKIIRSLVSGGTEVWTGKLDCFPYIDKTDCTFNTPASVTILLYFQ